MSEAPNKGNKYTGNHIILRYKTKKLKVVVVYNKKYKTINALAK